MFIYIYTLFLKFVNCFKPFIEKYIHLNGRNIIKTLSGLLENIPYIKPYIDNKIEDNKIEDNKIEDNKLLYNSYKKYKINIEKCNEVIIPGYIDHDPKIEALLKFRRK
jgi:hypothetical protein